MATQLKPAPLLNTSGIVALDLRVLVKPDDAAARIGSIALPPDMVERDKHAMQKGTIVCVGENAWEEAADRAARRGIDFRIPEPGDRVLIGKYAGVRLKGLDGADYVLLNDENIIGRLEE